MKELEFFHKDMESNAYNDLCELQSWKVGNHCRGAIKVEKKK